MEATKSHVQTIIRFVLDWFFFAPMALLLALLVGWLFEADLISSQVQSGALITYGLAFFLAFYGELPLDKLRHGGWVGRFVAVLVPIVHVAVVVLSLVGVVLVFALGALAQDAPRLLQDFLLSFGFVMVVLGTIVGVTSIATRIARERE